MDQPQEQNQEAPIVLWTIPQVCQALHLGRTKIYELISKDQLPVQRFGRAIRVSPVALDRWLKARTSE